MEMLTAHKDELIKEHGQQWWDEMTAEYDEMMKEREELDRLAAEIEADMEADEAAHGKSQT